MTHEPTRPEHSALAARAREWVRDLHACLEGRWDAPWAEDLHEAIDRLAMDAAAADDEEIEAAALELSTYLCSFIDIDAPPTTKQRNTLASLAANLAPDGEPARQPEPAAVTQEAVEDAPPQPQVWCISSDTDLIEALKATLAERGLQLVVREPSFSVAYAIPREGVRSVVVDNAALGILPELQRETLLQQATDATRPTYIAVLTDSSTGERVRALRAGADHVLSLDGHSGHPASRLGRVLDAQTKAPLNVLVIDDDRTHTAFCAGILRRVGIEATCCLDSVSALREIDRKLPDVVLVDLHMPGCDGFALTERLLEVPGSEFVSILFLSGDDEPETRFDALTAGADDFLAKPIQPRHLIRAVIAHGRRAQRRRAAVRAR